MSPTPLGDAAREQLLRHSLELCRMWFDLAGSLLAAPAPAPSGGSRDAPGDVGWALAVEAVEPRSVWARLDLPHAGTEAGLSVPELRSTAAGRPPLAGLHFSADPLPTLHIPVPRGQPTGHYVGWVYEAATGRPLGRLEVRLGPA